MIIFSYCFFRAAISASGTAPTGTPPSTVSATAAEGEPCLENRLILCSSRDDFVLTQDACAMCGSFGLDAEGRLLACAQCGQCYHPYCANVKVSKLLVEIRDD